MNPPKFGLQHKDKEPVVLFEYNLQDLYDLQAFFDYRDGFYKDIQSAVDYLEKLEKLRKEAEFYMPSLNIVVTERSKS